MDNLKQHIQDCLNDPKSCRVFGDRSDSEEYILVRVKGTLYLDAPEYGTIQTPLDTIVKVTDIGQFDGWFNCYDDARHFLERIAPPYIHEMCGGNFSFEVPDNGWGRFVDDAIPRFIECDEEGKSYYYDQNEYFDFNLNKPSFKNIQ